VEWRGSYGKKTDEVRIETELSNIHVNGHLELQRVIDTVICYTRLPSRIRRTAQDWVAVVQSCTDDGTVVEWCDTYITDLLKYNVMLAVISTTKFRRDCRLAYVMKCSLLTVTKHCNRTQSSTPQDNERTRRTYCLWSVTHVTSARKQHDVYRRLVANNGTTHCSRKCEFTFQV